MAPDVARRSRQLVFVMLFLASALIEVAADDTRSLWVSCGIAAAWVASAGLISRLVSRLSENRRTPPRWQMLILLGVAVAPFVIDPLRRRWSGTGYPFELQMVFGLRNLGLGLAVLGALPLALRLASAVSLFLVLFGLSLTDHAAAMPLLGSYCVVGVTWLGLVYWSGLRRFFMASQRNVTLEVDGKKQRMPWLALAAVVLLAGGSLGLMSVRPQRIARALGELLPTSGGTQGFDMFARGGVNDGDDEVAGDKARSTGIVESDLFLDSPLPSLYDMFNELYGDPRTPKEYERAIALDQQSKTNERQKPPADNLRPSRRFLLTRQRPQRQRDPSDRTARALFEVEGRTPLHVRVAAFDRFDGVAWQEAPMTLRSCVLVNEPKSCWMKVDEVGPTPVFAECETHRFSIARPVGALVPTPTHMSRFRLGRINKPDFFSWGQDRILRLAQRKAPAGATVETECRTVDPELLVSAEFRRKFTSERFEYTELPQRVDPRIGELALAWAGALPVGWAQVDAVLERLRSEYVLDSAAKVPDAVVDPLAHFLFDSRRGPDYQFASAAAVLLRHLGYATRLVSGFYVSPDHFDPATRHTPVVSEDVHFWAEVMLACGDWLVIEATPGYEVLGPKLPWWKRLRATALQAARWCGAHAAPLGFGLLAVAGFWWRRRDVADTALVLRWRLFPGRDWHKCLGRCLRLLERRGQWAGRPRRASQTVHGWLGTSLLQPDRSDPEIELLTSMTDWAAYAPDLAPPWRMAEVHGLCRRILGTWTLKRWRALASAGALSGAHS